jgi:hypothetical protein
VQLGYIPKLLASHFCLLLYFHTLVSSFHILLFCFSLHLYRNHEVGDRTDKCHLGGHNNLRP